MCYICSFKKLFFKCCLHPLQLGQKGGLEHSEVPLGSFMPLGLSSLFPLFEIFSSHIPLAKHSLIFKTELQCPSPGKIALNPSLVGCNHFPVSLPRLRSP